MIFVSDRAETDVIGDLATPDHLFSQACDQSQYEFEKLTERFASFYSSIYRKLRSLTHVVTEANKFIVDDEAILQVKKPEEYIDKYIPQQMIDSLKNKGYKFFTGKLVSNKVPLVLDK